MSLITGMRLVTLRQNSRSRGAIYLFSSVISLFRFPGCLTRLEISETERSLRGPPGRCILSAQWNLSTYIHPMPNRLVAFLNIQAVLEDCEPESSGGINIATSCCKAMEEILTLLHGDRGNNKGYDRFNLSRLGFLTYMMLTNDLGSTIEAHYKAGQYKIYEGLTPVSFPENYNLKNPIQIFQAIIRATRYAPLKISQSSSPHRGLLGIVPAIISQHISMCSKIGSSLRRYQSDILILSHEMKAPRMRKCWILFS